MESAITQLTADDILEARPFTHPLNSHADVALLQQMVERLFETVSLPGTVSGADCPVAVVVREPDGRKHRMVVCNLDELLAEQPITVVGFFGSQRPGADRAPLDEADEKLMAVFPEHSGLLAYSSMELGSGNWGNLVLMRGQTAVEHWASGTIHTYAAKVLAPNYYSWIRLHNAGLEGGIVSKGMIRLHRTKYFDFDGGQTWRGVRDMTSSLPASWSTP